MVTRLEPANVDPQVRQLRPAFNSFSSELEHTGGKPSRYVMSLADLEKVRNKTMVVVRRYNGGYVHARAGVDLFSLPSDTGIV